MVYNIYPKKLSEILLKNADKGCYMPRRIKDGEFLRLFRSYWTPEFNSIFKVESIFNEGEDVYYYIKYGNSAYYGVLSYPVNPECCYELFTNKVLDIKSNIINDNKMHSGAEIKYWFFINLSQNNNSDNSNEIYKCFMPFICNNGKAQLQDNRR